MSSEEKQFAKWVVILILCIVLAVIAAIFVMSHYPTSKQKRAVKDEAIPLPQTMTFTSAQLNEARDMGTTVDVKVRAIVEPINATNSAVDFSVAWVDYAPEWYPEVVTDYVMVTQDSDGSRTATVTCKKAFTDYNIVLTVTTRDGGYTASCLCSFGGIASDMTINIGYIDGRDTVMLEKTNSAKRGDYYELSEKKEYFVSIVLDNSFDCVTWRNIEWSLEANGELYFGNAVSDGYGILTFSDLQLKKLNDYVKTERFVTVGKNSDYSLRIVPHGTVEYSSASSENVDGYMHYTDTCVFDEYDLGVGGEIGVNEKNEHNVAEMPSCYFALTITDTVSELSETIRFWIVF